MATVFFMKFNNEQGALIADEMTWHLGFKYGYRPSRYGDSILNLISEDLSCENDFSAVYAGVGFPSLHEEVARNTRNCIIKDKSCLKDLSMTSEVVHEFFQKSMGRLIDDKLNFLLGINRDDFNKGKFIKDGKEYDIKQEAIMKEARKILKNQEKGDAYKRIFENEGVLMGYDKENGIRAYYIDNSSCNLDFAYPFGAIGSGTELGTKLFADSFYRKRLNERREGLNFADGLFLLMSCFVEAYDFNNKAGGYTQIFLIDGKKEEYGYINKEISDHKAHLATEVIRGYRWGLVCKNDAQGLVNRLIIKGEDWRLVEKEFFNCSKEPEKLKKYLMGYKPDLI